MGSEMCIRDSGQVVDAGQQNGKKAVVDVGIAAVFAQVDDESFYRLFEHEHVGAAKVQDIRVCDGWVEVGCVEGVAAVRCAVAAAGRESGLADRPAHAIARSVRRARRAEEINVELALRRLLCRRNRHRTQTHPYKQNTHSCPLTLERREYREACVNGWKSHGTKAGNACRNGSTASPSRRESHMSRPTSTVKVLRIAVLCSGRILTERLIDADANVRIGSDSLNDLVLNSDAFGASTALFTFTPAGYALTTLATMSGKVTVHEQPASIRSLVADGATSVSLCQDDRGKLVVGDTTVLFQFVAPPPTAAHLLPGSLDFRPRLFEEDDPIFVGATAIFTGLAAVMLAWVYTSPPPSVVQMIELDPRIARVFLQPTPQTPEPAVEVDPIAPPVPAPAESQEPEIADVTPPADGVLPDGRNIADMTDEERLEEVMNNDLVIGIIAGLGEAAGPATAGVFGQHDVALDRLDVVLDGVQGVRVADRSDDGPRTVDGTNNGDVDISGLHHFQGGNPIDIEQVVVELEGEVYSPEFQPEPDIEDPEAIQDAVEANHGRLVACYDRILKNDPTLQGRVDVEFYISQGRVTQAEVFADTTHNSEFTGCLTGAIRRIRFPTETTGEVVFPFIFSARN